MSELAAPIRFLLAAAIWLFPGWALARGLFTGRDPLAFVSFAGAVAVATSVSLVFVAYLLHISAREFHLLLYGAAGIAVAYLIFSAGRERRDGAPDDAVGLPGRFTRMTGWSSFLLLAFAGYRAGATIRFSGDGPNHVAFVREILASGSFFPTETFHLGAGLLGADPRMGLLHPVYAGLAAMSGLDPIDLWALLPLVALPLSFGGAYLLLRGLQLRPTLAVLGAWLLLFTFNRGSLANCPFPNQVGAALYWAGAGTLLMGLGRPTLTGAFRAAFLIFGTMLVHATGAVYYALFGTLTLMAVQIVRRAPKAETGFLFLTAGLAAVPFIPFLLVRQSMFVLANPLHTELQGMLLLGDGRFVTDPQRIARALGPLGLIAYPVALFTFARRWRVDRAAFLVFWGVITILSLTLNPWLVPVLQRNFSYLIFRLFWLLPPAVVTMTTVAALLNPVVKTPAAVARPLRARWFALALLVIGCIPAARAAISARWLLVPTARTEATDSPLPWRRGFEDVARRIPPRSVILTDPVTGSVLPAFTGLKVTANLDQHSSPNDSLVIRRIVTARDVLSPAVPAAEAAALTRAAGANYVLVNEHFVDPILTFYMVVDPGALARRERQLEASDAWELMARQDGFALFRPRAGAADSLLDPGPGTLAKPPANPRLPRDAGLALVAASASPVHVDRGDSLAVDMSWTLAGGPVQADQRIASIRLDSLDPAAHGFPGGKVGRKIRERLRGVLYRCRVDWIPGAGLGASALPPDRWRPGEVVKDRVLLEIPMRLAPGRYAVSVGVSRFAAMPNYTLADYFTDNDYYSGAPVDTITVVR